MKKFLSLFVCLMVCLSTTVLAATNLSDVKGTKYEIAVDKLVYFKIVNGYEDNTYRPKKNVTRAELSKMLVLALGKEEYVEAAKNKYLSFTDVLSNYWGYGYIKVASDEQLVNGYTDGTFMPDGNVTYAEATTMVLRALGYKEEVERSSLKWPNNYMVYADEKLELFESISEFKAGDPANRGDIAILIWNALRTGVCDIVAQNSNGLVYGEGDPMISEYLGYTYYEDAEIVDIEFSSNFVDAEVALDVGARRNVYFTFKAEEVLEMFGNTISILVDDTNDKIVDLEFEDEYDRIEGEVDNITDTKIYLPNKRNGYKRPDDENILLFGIKTLDEAAEVILLMDGSNVEYCIAMGSSDVYIGLVTSDYVQVNSESATYGIRIRDVDVTKGGTSYVVANEDKWPENDDIIMYFFNSDDQLVVLRNIKAEGAVKVASVTDEYVKVSKNVYYEYDDEDDYTVVTVNGSRIKSATLEDISVANDKVNIVTYNGHIYFFVFKDAVLDSLDEATVDALELLEETIYEAEELNEAECSQETYAVLMSALKSAKEVDHTYSVTKINRATTKLREALDNMERAKSKEKEIVSLKKALRAMVQDEALDIIEDEDLYTSSTYEDFYIAYEAAEKVLARLAATYDEVEDAYDDLEDAIYDLEERD